MEQFEFDPMAEQEAASVRRALASGDITVFVDGTAVRLSGETRRGIERVLTALAAGERVRVSGGDGEERPSSSFSGLPQPELLTTSQAARAAGISLTYLRNLTDAGEIPVEYRGTHRRFKAADIAEWVERHRQRKEQARGGNPGSA